MLTLDELRALGVTVVVCPPRKAKGVKKQKMRAKLAGAFTRGGDKPEGISQLAYEAK